MARAGFHLKHTFRPYEIGMHRFFCLEKVVK